MTVCKEKTLEIHIFWKKDTIIASRLFKAILHLKMSTSNLINLDNLIHWTSKFKTKLNSYLADYCDTWNSHNLLEWEIFKKTARFYFLLKRPLLHIEFWNFFNKIFTLWRFNFSHILYDILTSTTRAFAICAY